MRDRTADLLRARQALSQLSYSPIQLLQRPSTTTQLLRSFPDGKHVEDITLSEECNSFLNKAWLRAA